jgi:light-regulated signal transduction histidine kinase (bacteriophytochrome)
MLVPEGLRGAYDHYRDAYFAAPTVQIIGAGLELAGLRKDGSEFPAQVGLSFVQTHHETLALGFVSDLTARKRIRDELRQTHTELLRSNSDLEQFAYVASHDLQEPLRMISSYLGLLERRYKNQLDADARQLIQFAVDGAARMKVLIEDLLSFSRVGGGNGHFGAVSSQTVLENTLAVLKASLEESGAEVTWDPLPPVIADSEMLTRVLQNLIANAVKFRGNRTPRIHISAERQERYWTFALHDNGIGIEPRHFDRIFRIFERLESADEYPGTGVGLAICKKIIEQHGGRMWVHSQPGEGSTFYFTVPAQGVGIANRAGAR